MDTISETLAPAHDRRTSFGWVFVDGSFRRADDARVSVHAHVLSYGTGTFEGITRRQVLELIGEELGERVVERSVDRSELYVCDEALLCGTSVQIVPLVEVDRRPVGDGRPGERTRRLVEVLARIARRETDAHADWTTPVWR